MQTLLVTGGLGFIGSRFIAYVLSVDPTVRVINLDNMSYAALGGSRWPGFKTMGGVYSEDLDCHVRELGARHKFLRCSVHTTSCLNLIFHKFQPDAVVHFAAETHVDRAIESSRPFVLTNVLGTQNLLETARQYLPNARFLYVSTDEVYGACPLEDLDEGFREDSVLAPRNPYAASKAAGEHLAMSYYHTHNLHVLVTRGCNTYGPWQHPEKFIPLLILNAQEGKPLPVYGDGRQVREWLHVMDHCEAIFYLLQYGVPGKAYNIGSGQRHMNLEIAREICTQLGQPLKLIKHVEDRPGHDRAYSLNTERLQEHWQPSRPSILSCLSSVIRWYTQDDIGAAWSREVGDSARKRRGLTQETSTCE
jgi:dTDP-glucose 4,6-dehydratase